MISAAAGTGVCCEFGFWLVAAETAEARLACRKREAASMPRGMPFCSKVRRS